MSRDISTLVEDKSFAGRFALAVGAVEPAKIQRKLGISYQAAKNYLEGRLPSPDVLQLIAEKTGYSIHWLLTGKGPQMVDGSGIVVISVLPEERAALEALAGDSGCTISEEAQAILAAHFRERGLIKPVSESSNIIFFGEFTHMIELPLMGEIAAGGAMEPVQMDERVSVPDLFRPKPGTKYMVLRVRGDSMIGDDIRDGSLIICEVRAHAANGEIVAALIDGQNATVKRFYKEANRVRLQPANPLHRPIYVEEDQNLEIQGVVVGIWRSS